MDLNIFREYDIRGVVGRQLTAETVAAVGAAAGTYFRDHGAANIALGYDARASSPEFAAILTGELTATGCSVVNIGMVPTPVLYYATHQAGIDGGIMITGSHNPSDHNGFKISLGKNSLFGEQIAAIRDIAVSGRRSSGAGSVTSRDLLAEYAANVTHGISLGSRPIKVVVDAGNGMGAVTAVPIYEKLGVEVVPLFAEPDASFPNHHADPTVEENLVDLIEAVHREQADLGIAFDGDGDRVGVVDEQGRVIWGDELMIPIARSILGARPGSTMIAEVKCSQTLFDEIERRGGRALMWKAGHSIIKAKMKETGAVLAGEMSGHFFFADRYFGFDDACYTGARLIELLSHTDEPFSALFSHIPKTFSTPELRVFCPDQIKFEVVRRIAERYREHKVITIDGARIPFKDGWGLVRPSNTQELLVLRFEASSEAALQRIRRQIETEVEEEIDICRRKVQVS